MDKTGEIAELWKPCGNRSKEVTVAETHVGERVCEVTEASGLRRSAYSGSRGSDVLGKAGGMRSSVPSHCPSRPTGE